MKKIIFSLIITFTMLLLTNIESNGQCASGFTSKIITMNIGGCNYDIELCYKCALTHPGEVYVRRIIKHPTTPPCSGWDSYDVLDYVYNYVTTGQFIYSTLCFWTNIPPCPNQSDIIKVNFSFCWKEIIDTNYFGTPTVVIETCDDNYCETSMRFCVENGVLVRQYFDAVIKVEIPNCPEYDTIEFGDCFIFHTDCNP